MIERRQLFDTYRCGVLNRSEQRFPQRFRIRVHVRGEQLAAAIIEVNECGVYAVNAGAGNKTGENGATRFGRWHRLQSTATAATRVCLNCSSSLKMGLAVARKSCISSRLIGSACGRATVRGLRCTPFKRYS